MPKKSYHSIKIYYFFRKSHFLYKKNEKYIVKRHFGKTSNSLIFNHKIGTAYGRDTITVSPTQFRFRFSYFDVKDVSRIGSQLSKISITSLSLSQKTVWDHLNKAGYERKELIY